MERRTNYLEATNTSDLYFKHNHVAWRCFGVSKAIDLQTVIADTAGRHVYSNNDNDAQKRDRADPNYHGKVNRILYLFLVQASGDAFSEVHFKQGRTQDLELGGGAKAEGRKGGGCGSALCPLPLQLGGMGERFKLPHWGLGRSPRSFASSAT